MNGRRLMAGALVLALALPWGCGGEPSGGADAGSGFRFDLLHGTDSRGAGRGDAWGPDGATPGPADGTAAGSDLAGLTDGGASDGADEPDAGGGGGDAPLSGDASGDEDADACVGRSCPPPLDPPGGRTRFVVALGALHSGAQNDGLVRLGTYEFDPDTQTVEAALWEWSQASPGHREHSAVVPGSACAGGAGEVRACEILTAPGFREPPNLDRTAAYDVKTDPGTDAPYVRMQWSSGGAEEWWLPTTSAETYATLRFKAADEATVGFAFGSDAALAERRGYADVIQKTGLTFEKWIRKQACSECADAAVNGALNPSNHFSTWTLCGDQEEVMTRYDPESGGNCEGSMDSSIQFYMLQAGADRRDAWWFWHSCKTESGAWNTCYGCDDSDRHGGSRVYALLQVLDDQGQFVGYVGVEAAFHEGSCNDPTQHRESDVLGVIRLTPEAQWLCDPDVIF